MEYIRKYNTATHIYIPIIKRAVVDFAVGADWTPAAGDVKISKDGAAAANVTNLPTAIVMGNGAMWDFNLTATELQAAKIEITIVDAATKAVEDTMISIVTFGNASAEYAVDFSDSAAFGLSRLDAAVTTRLAPTVAGRTLDVSTGGEAGLDWANIGSPTTAQTLSGTSTKAVEPTVAGRTLDVSATGEAGVDWANVGGQSTTVNLSATTVKTLTDAPADSAGVTTLLSRIPAALFSGITSLAQWLGLIAGKQTGNSTARTELRATGAGSGTYDETTDSQEATRDNMGTPQTGDSYPTVNTNLNATITSRADGSVYTSTRAGYLDNLNALKIKKNTALNNFAWLMVQSSDHLSPATGLTVTCQRSIDGAGFANCTTSTATEVANGVYKVNLSASDLNGDVIVLKFTATGADQRTIVITTEP